MSGIEYYEIMIGFCQAQLKDDRKHIKLVSIILLGLFGLSVLDFSFISSVPSNDNFSLGLSFGSILGASLYTFVELITAISNYVFTKREILNYQALREQLLEFSKSQNPYGLKDGPNVSSVFPGQYL